MIRWFKALSMLTCVALLNRPASAYVDMAPTLGRVVSEAKMIAVVEVDKFSREKKSVILKEIRRIHGDAASAPIRHRVSETPESAIPRHVLEWCEAGNRAVVFVSEKNSLVCLGAVWYQVGPAEAGWSKLGASRPDLPLAYSGSVSRLADAVTQMVAGKEGIITVMPHGDDAQAASFDVALNRGVLPGLAKLERVKASLKMPGNVMAMSNNPAYVLGTGTADLDDVPQLLTRLKSKEVADRIESADDLRTLGPTAGDEVAVALEACFADPSPRVRFASAAAFARVRPSAATKAIDVLARGLVSADASERRHAATNAALAGSAAGPLADSISKLLADPDELVRLAALQAVSTLGPSAAVAVPAIVPLLNDPEHSIGAADALGRIGPAARPVPPAMVKMLSSDQLPVRWAAVRAMSQIGGVESHPAVEFMIKELAKGSIVDTYNMMIYLALLGPVAKDALPAIRSARVMQPALKPATLWAIEPDKSLPWQGGAGLMGMFGGPGGGGPGGGRGGLGPPGMGGPGGDGRGLDVVNSIYEAYVHELGPRLRPAVAPLAKKILEGKAGEVPAYGYRLLNCASDDALSVLIPGLAGSELVLRERAAVAIGFMGPSASAAKPQLSAAIDAARNEREKRLMRWCLREVSK